MIKICSFIEQPTAADFGRSVGMNNNDVANMRKVLKAIAEGDTDGFKVCAVYLQTSIKHF